MCVCGLAAAYSSVLTDLGAKDPRVSALRLDYVRTGFDSVIWYGRRGRGFGLDDIFGRG